MKVSSLSIVAILQLQKICSGLTVGNNAPSSCSLAPATTRLSAATSLPLAGDLVSVEEEEVEESNVGVLLLNLGGPEKTDDVEGMFEDHKISS